MLDFRMETFMTVCRCMNYTRASEELKITQPAVSQQIRYLEKHYNAKLFRYEGKKLKLTDAGEILRDASLSMMNDEASLKNRIQKADKSQGNLRLGSTTAVGEMMLPDILERYMRKYPDVQVQMDLADTDRLLEKVNTGELDFVLTEGFFDREAYDYQVLSEERFIAVAGPRYRFVNMKKSGKLKLEELLGERLLLREPGSGSREVLEHLLDAEKLKPEGFVKRAEVSGLHTVKALAKAGCGITFLYESTVHEELQKGELTEIPLKDVHVCHEFSAVWKKGNAVHASFLNALEKNEEPS